MSNIDNKNIVQNSEEKDIIYARKYWENPQRTPRDFFEMLETLENSVDIKTLEVNTDLATKTGKQLLSAYRRLGTSLGYSMGEFKKNNDKSICTIDEGDPNNTHVQQGQKDREYMKIYWSKYAKDDPDTFFSGIKSAIDENENNTLSTFADKNDEYLLARLSTFRVMSRAFGIKVGNYTFSPRAGTAIAPIKK